MYVLTLDQLVHHLRQEGKILRNEDPMKKNYRKEIVHADEMAIVFVEGHEKLKTCYSDSMAVTQSVQGCF